MLFIRVALLISMMCLLPVIFIFSEKKDIRDLTASGVIKVVRANWLEDCDRLKKEITVLPRHTGYDLLLPRGFPSANCKINNNWCRILCIF